MAERLLDVRHLHTSFFTHLGEVKAIRDVSFHVDKSEIIGIVGESGSGKSVTSLSVMGLLAHPGKVTEGEILFKGEDLLKKKKREMRKPQNMREEMNQHPAHAPPNTRLHKRSVRYAPCTRLLFHTSATR